MKQKNRKIVQTTTWSAGPGCHGGCGVLAHIEDGKSGIGDAMPHQSQGLVGGDVREVRIGNLTDHSIKHRHLRRV